MPLNHAPGAVVTLMDRSNVDTVMVAGQIRKQGGQLVGVDLLKLNKELEACETICSVPQASNWIYSAPNPDLCKQCAREATSTLCRAFSRGTSSLDELTASEAALLPLGVTVPAECVQQGPRHANRTRR
jgi:hypothetical protein